MAKVRRRKQAEKQPGIIGRLVGLAGVLGIFAFIGLLIWRIFVDVGHRAEFDDDLPWLNLTEAHWLATCFGGTAETNRNDCRSAQDVLWAVRLERLDDPETPVVSLTDRRNRTYEIDLELAAPIAWPADPSSLIGKRMLVAGRLSTDLLLGHDIEDASIWGFPYGPAGPASADRLVDFVLFDYHRMCRKLSADAFAERCLGKRIALDVEEVSRDGDRMAAELPIQAEPRPKVVLTLTGRWHLNRRDRLWRVVGTIADGSGRDGTYLVLDPASILTDTR